MPAPNKQFGTMAGVTPLILLCKFASFAPVRTVVSPPLRQAAGTLAAMAGQCTASMGKNEMTNKTK